MKKTTFIRSMAVLLIVILLGGTIVSCKSDVNMTRRKKSRYNTCPTFSYAPNNHNDATSIDIAGLY